MSSPAEQEAHARRFDEAVEALRKEAGKRFWELYWDENLHWYGVRDQLGRIMCSPRPETAIRGFFAGLEPQA